MKELTSGMTARELIPGVPEDIERLATRLIEYSDAAMTGVARLRSTDAGLWVGQAAESFSAQVGQLPAKLSRAAGAFQDAAFALRSYAGVLRDAQRVAARAAELFEEGERRSRSSRLDQGARLAPGRTATDPLARHPPARRGSRRIATNGSAASP